MTIITSAEVFSAETSIIAPPNLVWHALTDLEIMKRWLGDPEMNIGIETTWEVGSPIFIRGFHHVPFENKGVVLKYTEGRVLSFSHLSSVSHLPDKPENYSILEFTLAQTDDQTRLELLIKQFPTESIRRHLEFYWRTTLTEIKRLVETPYLSK